MFITRPARDAFKKGTRLPFPVQAKHSRNENQAPHPDYQIMQKITWPMLPPLRPEDRATRNNREQERFERENLFGMDHLLGQELNMILDRVEKPGYVLVIGFLEFPFDNADYVFQHAHAELAEQLQRLDATLTHRYPKHVRDHVFSRRRTAPLQKIAFKNTDICYASDLAKLGKVLALLKKSTMNFVLLGGMALGQCMSVKGLESIVKQEAAGELKMDKLRGETLGILQAPLNETYAILKHNPINTTYSLLKNHPINKTHQLLQQQQMQLLGLLGQLGDKKKEPE